MRTPKIALIALSKKDAKEYISFSGLPVNHFRVCLSEKDIRYNLFTSVQATEKAKLMKNYDHLMTIAQMRVVTNAE